MYFPLVADLGTESLNTLIFLQWDIWIGTENELSYSHKIAWFEYQMSFTKLRKIWSIKISAKLT